MPGPSATDLLNQYDTVQQAAQQFGVRPELIHAVMQQESGGDPSAKSRAGAIGLMQLMPATAKELGVDPNDPTQNILGGTKYLRQLLDHYGGDEQKALAAYNAGIGRVDRGGPLPAETQNYVPAVEKRAAAPQQSATDLLHAYDQSQDQGFVGNALDSAGNFASGLVNTLRHPVTSAEALAKTSLGGYQRLADLAGIPTGVVDQLVGNQRPMADATHDFYANRYGSAQALKHTLYTDPVGAAADASALIGGVGDIADAANFGRTADVLQGASRLLDPARLPTNAASAFQPAENAMARRIVSSNLKIPKLLKKQNRNVDIPGTILDEGLAKGNIAKARDAASAKIADLGNQVSNLAAGDAATGRTYSLQPLMDELDKLEAEYQHQPNAQADLAAVQQAKQNLLNNPLYATPATPPTTVQVPHPTAVDAAGNPIMQAQTVPGSPAQLIPQNAVEIDRMKKNVYGGLKGKYGKEQSGVIEADKAEGRGLKNILNQNIPGMGDLNARQGDVIAAHNTLSDAAMREENKYPIGLMDLAAMGAGGVSEMAHSVLHNPALAAGAAMATVPAAAAVLLKHPTTAMPIARGLWSAGHASFGRFEPAVQAVTPAQRINQATQRPVTLDEARRLYQQIYGTDPLAR